MVNFSDTQEVAKLILRVDICARFNLLIVCEQSDKY